MVSFVVATYNRGQVLLDCLRHTLTCGLPQSQFDIRVVDNASTDGAGEMLQSFQTLHSNVHVFTLKKNGGPVAKNVAIHNNPADLIVLLDDDAYPMPGAVPQMIRHFREDPHLGAAVFDVTLPDGAKEASAYPDVFIGAGTALRSAALKALQRRGVSPLLPAHFFMQAEEYDLSFRLLAAGYSVQRFWDMPLMHLKSPGARIGQRTTRLDVRNNLYVLARYLPEPLCHQLAADWLARYWLMAARRDAEQGVHPVHGTHKAAYLKGAAQGLKEWTSQRNKGGLLLNEATLEKIFKFRAIRERLARAKENAGLRRVAFADLGKNMLAFWQAANSLKLEVTAILDDQLATGEREVDYRGIPIVTRSQFMCRAHHERADALVLTALSPVHAQKRAAALRRVCEVPVIDLFSRRDALLHRTAVGTTVEMPTLARL
jgi:GT2 family glycosyltransferase